MNKLPVIQNFAQDKRAVLLWHVQKYCSHTRAENRFPSNFTTDRKIINMGPQAMVVMVNIPGTYSNIRQDILLYARSHEVLKPWECFHVTNCWQFERHVNSFTAGVLSNFIYSNKLILILNHAASRIEDDKLSCQILKQTPTEITLP